MINVVWWDRGRGNWDHGLLMGVFDKYQALFRQYNEYNPPMLDRAIVVVVNKPEIAPLRAWLDTLPEGLVILTSDEDAYFNYRMAIPERFEIWTSYYHASKSDIKERFLLGAPTRIKDYKINRHLPKTFLWSFVGQMQNPFRHKAVNILKDLKESGGELSNGFLHRAPMFGGQLDGIEYQEYLDIMRQSTYVICPAGSMCVDSFRFYEALECGAIPITDKRSPRDAKDFDYWNECLDEFSANQIIRVDDWDELPGQLRILSRPLDIWGWWYKYKIDFENKLLRYAMDGN